MNHKVKVTVTYDYEIADEHLEKGYGIKPTETEHAIRTRIFQVDGHGENLIDLMNGDEDALVITMEVDGEVRTIED